MEPPIKIEFLLYILYRRLNGIEQSPNGSHNRFLFRLKTKTDAIHTTFKNAIAEVEQNMNAIMEELMNKAGLQIDIELSHITV